MDDAIRVAMITKGGAGSLFIYANFLYCLKEYLQGENIEFIVIGHKSKELNDFIFEDGELVKEYYCAEEEKNALGCDAAFEINFYPRVLFESDSVERQSERLHNLFKKWRTFFLEDRARNYLSTNLHRDHNTYIYARINGKTFVNIGDIGGIIGIEKDYRWKVNLDNPEKAVRDLGLEPGMYITLQCGATPGTGIKNSPKQWPQHRYEELIGMLKRIYPEKRIVQLGEKSNSDPINGVDCCLLGKTSWKQLAAVLKHAWLHIDGECGMVHLRKMLTDSPSVVLFGSTPMDFYAYENNINVSSYACKYPCARLTDYWLERCMLGEDVPPCMEKISAAQVMEAIVKRDCLDHIKEGNEISYLNEKLYKEPDVSIDEDYKKRYLDYINVFSYSVERIPIDELTFCVMGEHWFEWVSLYDTPAYKTLKGDKNVYAEYSALLKKNNNDFIHTPERFKTLVDKVNAEGIDENRCIIIDGRNRVLDGQHRAAILASKNGPQYEAKVVRIMGINLFPFDKVKRGSKILLYGAGMVGLEYLDQITKTCFCDVLAMVDQRPYLWNDIAKNRARAQCIYPEQIPEYMEECDYIVVSSTNDMVVDQIKEKLDKIGIDKDMIVARAR